MSSWAFSTAFTLPGHKMCELQVVPYACVRRFAPELIKAGEEEFKRQNRFWAAPLKSWGVLKNQFALACSLYADMPPRSDDLRPYWAVIFD
jgi:hypothetical protein